MAVTVRNIKSGAAPNLVLLNDHTQLTAPADNNRPVYENDLLATTGSAASVEIASDGQCAAIVQGANSSISVYSPPSYGLDRIYYNNSYRYKLRTPGGYVGIRG
jgi:hypothetical protein